MELGATLRILGNVIYHMIFEGLLPGDTPQERLSELWTRIDQVYALRKPPSQLGNLKMSMFCNERGPSQHQPEMSVKAAESRNFVPVLKEVFEAVARPGNIIDEHIAALLDALLTYYNCVKCTELVLP